LRAKAWPKNPHRTQSSNYIQIVWASFVSLDFAVFCSTYCFKGEIIFKHFGFYNIFNRLEAKELSPFESGMSHCGCQIKFGMFPFDTVGTGYFKASSESAY